MTPVFRTAAVVVACGGIGTGLAAADPAPLDGWQGLKAEAVNAGITPNLTYEVDAADNLSGGLRRAATYSSNLHLQLSLDGERLAGVPGMSGLVDVLWINGGNPSKLVGDAQGVSSIAAPAAVRLYEAWAQYDVLDGRASVLAGRYDVNTEFYRLISADLFFNSSFGIGPELARSGFGDPSIFPDTSLALRAAYKPSRNSVLRVALVDAAPLDPQAGSPAPLGARSSALLLAEWAVLRRPGTDVSPDQRFRIGRHPDLSSYDGKIAIGAWCYTAGFPVAEPAGVVPPGAPTHREAGAYLLLDETLLRDMVQPKRHLTGFLQAGVTDPQVDRFGYYLGGGLVGYGVLASRPNDQVGMGAAMAHNGSGYLAAEQQMGQPVYAAETVIELTYLAPVAPVAAVQPDFAYVIHPNTSPRIRNATVLQVRFQIAL